MDEGLTTRDLGRALEDLWSDELCCWRVERHGNETPWCVILEWTQERDNEHHADWTTFTWQFYGESVEEALADAVEWCRGLLPFRHCRECDGRGEYGGPRGATVACEDCGGTGRDPEGKTW